MTQQAKHTPGPWHVGKHTRINIFAGEQLVAMPGDGLTYQEAEANGRLIAAAPELLAALKAFENGFADGSIKWAKPRQADSDPYHPANVAMCAAIAKAEGR